MTFSKSFPYWRVIFSSLFVRWKNWLIPDFFRWISPHLYCWRNGLTKTSCPSKGSAKSYNWGEAILGTITYWEPPSRKQLCKTTTWRVRLFPLVPRDRTSGSGHRPKHRTCFLDFRKLFVTVRVSQHWQRLPRKVVESPSLEIKKTYVLTWSQTKSSVWSYSIWGAWARWPPETPDNFIHAVIMQRWHWLQSGRKYRGLLVHTYVSASLGRQYKVYFKLSDLKMLILGPVSWKLFQCCIPIKNTKAQGKIWLLVNLISFFSHTTQYFLQIEQCFFWFI